MFNLGLPKPLRIACPPLHHYSTYFYKNAGLPTDQAFNLSLAQHALGFFGTIGSWVLVAHFGRRTLYTGGLVIHS
jgi:MFS transporter, SP family, general alpha glucoside:H+ symporter